MNLTDKKTEKKIKAQFTLQVNFDIDGKYNLSPEEVLNNIVLNEHDAIDGYELTTSIDGCDPTQDFFLKYASIVDRTIIDIDDGQVYSEEVSANIRHAKEAIWHCKAIKEAINGLCDILDISDDGFGESDQLGAYKAIFQKASAWEKQYEDYIYRQKEKAEIASCMKRKFQITDFFDQATTVYPRLGLYEVRDFMDKPMHILSIQMYSEDGEPYATLTKSFGEFIGAKNCAYIDTNNCPFAKLLLELGVAKDTGMTKASGFCKYPLWEFDEGFLKDIGGEKYEQYSKEFDDYMGVGEDEEPEIDSFEQSM